MLKAIYYLKKNHIHHMPTWVCKHRADETALVSLDSIPSNPVQATLVSWSRCVTEPLTRVMSHCVVEGCAAWVWCIRHPQCGSQSPLPVTVAIPVGWLLCQGGLQATRVEGKAQERQGYELQWPSGKFSPVSKWELVLWSFSFHTVSHTTSVPQPAVTLLEVTDGLTPIQIKQAVLFSFNK